MKKSSFTLLTLFFLFNIQVISQNTNLKSWSLNGYVSSMQSFMFQNPDSNWTNDNLIHNRLNFKWYANDYFTITIESRNRFIYGETIKYYPGYAKQINSYDGVKFLSKNIFDKKSFLLNTTFDRAIIAFSKNNIDISIGRQRINWGRCIVWNPNDLFNNYSFFDFDYVEKPGSDALRVQYYTGTSTVTELAVKIDSSNKITAAGLTKFSTGNYDIQLIGGILKEQDFVIGTGWEGNIKSFGFRGEMSYFHPKQNFTDTSGIFISSISLDYTFSNSLFIQTEVLYNQMKGNNAPFSFQNIYSASLSAKHLSFSEFTWFLQASLPITPLLNSSFSSIYYPDFDGWFIGPSLTYSLSENTEFSFFFQTFTGKLANNKKANFYLGFLRIKYNF